MSSDAKTKSEFGKSIHAKLCEHIEDKNEMVATKKNKGRKKVCIDS